MKRKSHYQPKPRTTVPLRGTTSRIELKLDHSSELAVEWARQWLKTGPAAMGVDPLASGVARRALAVYMAHLQRGDLDAAQEARAVRAACSTFTADTEDRDAAWKRLAGHQQGQPFPPFTEVLHGPREAQDWAAFNDRSEALAADLLAGRRQRGRPTGMES